MVLKQLSLAIQESQKTKPDYTHFPLIGSLHLWLQNLHLSLLGIERFSIEGGTPKTIGQACAATLPKPFPYLRPLKICDFPCHVYDLTKHLIPHSRPDPSSIH